MKLCKICNVDKQVKDFYKHANTKDRLRSECIECWNKLCLNYYINNKERTVEKRKDYHFRRNYGLSKEEVEILKNKQNSQCSICLEISDLVIDHDHINGHVRGLLCSKCNQGLGSFKDNEDNLERAANYVKNSKGNVGHATH